MKCTRSIKEQRKLVDTILTLIIQLHILVSKTPPNYVQLYYTQHKGPCRTAAFSADGRFAATGSHDSSLKVLDVQKMKKRTGEAGDKPVIRTLYDHTAPVNDLSFHPNGLVLASCAEDQSVKLFDLSKSGVKRSFRYLQVDINNNLESLG